jgi:hypothetical protein
VGSNACAAAGGWRIEQGALGGVDGLCISAAPRRAGQYEGEPAGPPVGVGPYPDHLPERVGDRPSPPTVGACWPQQWIHHRDEWAAWRQPELLLAAAPASRQRHGRARSRTAPPLIVPLARHSRSSSAASGPVPCSRYCRSPWLENGRPWMGHARQRQSQVCGVHGRASPGLGQQVHLWPLPNPDPGGMLISPGRPGFRRPTSRHRPWPGCQAPTNPASRRERQAGAAWRPPYSPALGPAGQDLGVDHATHAG